MAQWLITYTVITEGLSLVPRTCIRQLITTCNQARVDLKPLASTGRRYTYHSYIYINITCVYVCIYSIIYVYLENYK